MSMCLFPLVIQFPPAGKLTTKICLYVMDLYWCLLQVQDLRKGCTGLETENMDG